MRLQCLSVYSNQIRFLGSYTAGDHHTSIWKAVEKLHDLLSVSICYVYSLKIKSLFTSEHSEQRNDKAQTHMRIPPPTHTHTRSFAHRLALVSNQIRVWYANISKKHRPFLWRAFFFDKVNGTGQGFSNFLAGVPLSEINNINVPPSFCFVLQ